MKWPQFFLSLLFLVFSITGAAQIKAGTLIRPKEVTAKDSIEYYETEFVTKQKSYMNLLTGTWTVTTMKRQAKMDAENLSNVSLQLNADSSFSGKAGCNNISGKFSIKGTSIKFKNVTATKLTCSNQEQEDWFLKLLQNTVSAYTVTDQMLLLRDGSSNIVFEGSRKGN